MTSKCWCQDWNPGSLAPEVWRHGLPSRVTRGPTSLLQMDRGLTHEDPACLDPCQRGRGRKLPLPLPLWSLGQLVGPGVGEDSLGPAAFSRGRHQGLGEFGAGRSPERPSESVLASFPSFQRANCPLPPANAPCSRW